jgi:hypothetical protein
MDIAALASFALLLLAWIVAPDRPRRTEVRATEPAAPEAQPLAA